MPNRDFREALPNDIEELKDIVEMQLVSIKSLQNQLRPYSTDRFTNITFSSGKPDSLENS